MIRFIFCLLFLALGIPNAYAEKPVLDVQVVKSASGIGAWLVEDHSVPVISISFSFEGGLLLDPLDKPGVGKLVSILLDEGAGDLKSQQFQEKLSNNAISLSFTPGRDAFHGRLRTITAHKDTAFELLRLALTKPRFDPDALVRMKDANTASIKKDLGDPSWLAARLFNGMLFEGHIYAQPGAGHLLSMQQITRADLLEFVRSQFARNVLRVSIVGDITAGETIELLDRIFGELPEKADIPEVNPATLAHAGKIVLLPLDTPQTYISTGQKGIARDDKDWHAAVIMNYVLGGGSFDARLMREIREKRGLTYGVYSTILNMRGASVLQATMSTANEKAVEALQLLKEEFKKMSAEGVTPEELRDAKSYITGSLALELTSTSDIAETLNALQRDNLSPDYINKRNNMINAVTLADIRRVAARLLKTDEMTVIMVGKPLGIDVDILLDRPPGMKEPPQRK